MRRTEVLKYNVAKFGLAVSVATAAAILAAPCGFAQTQDAQPSVADAARAAAAAKKDKEKAAASKNVITDENLGIGGATTSKAAVGGAAAAPGADATGGGANPAALDGAWARLQATEASLERLEPMGKSEVAATVLGGSTNDFPGRAEWEEKMYAEKTTYCARSRQLIQAMKEALLRMAAMNTGDHKVTSSNDPQVVSLTRKTTQLMQLAAKTEQEFQGVIAEGRQLAAGAGK